MTIFDQFFLSCSYDIYIIFLYFFSLLLLINKMREKKNEIFIK